MSHTSRVTTAALTDLDALVAAVEELAREGIRIHVEKDATPRSYFGTEQKGMEHTHTVIRLPDAVYDVGVYDLPDGTRELRTDFYGGSVAKVLGGRPGHELDKQDNGSLLLGKLLQRYQVVAAESAARNAGYTDFERQVMPDGEIQLLVSIAA